MQSLPVNQGYRKSGVSFRWLLAVLYFLFMCILMVRVHNRFDTSKAAFANRTDIKAQWLDAKMLSEGKNPYTRVNDPSLSKNRLTYYFPGFLLASAASIKMGVTSFPEWMKGWRMVSMASHLLVGLVLFALLSRSHSLLAAVLGSGIWFMSRWPLALFKSGQIDSIAIFFWLLSLLLLSRYKKLGYLSFGLSLAVKQMAIFAFPLYLLWAYQDAKPGKRLRSLMEAGFLSLLIPGLLCLPFILWDFQSFLQMFIFPLTRSPIGPKPVSGFLGIKGLLGALPMIVMMGMTYVVAARNQIPRYTQLLLVMCVFLSFTGVFFSRHVNWLVPFLPLVAFDATVKRPQNLSEYSGLQAAL